MPIHTILNRDRFIRITFLTCSLLVSGAQASIAETEPAVSISAEQPESASNIAGPFTNAPADQVLVRVGSQDIRAIDLEQALSSSPVSTTFISMSEDNQARVRGDMLQRLIAAELVYLEAVAQGIPERPAYRLEMASYRTSFLAQQYLASLRTSVAMPETVLADLRQRLRGDQDAIDAAQAAYIARNYPQHRQESIAKLRRQYHLRTYPGRISEKGDAQTVVAEADGFKILLGQLRGGLDRMRAVDQKKAMKQRLEEGAEVALMAQAAIDAGIDVSIAMDRYGHDLAARLLMRDKQNEWVSSEAAKRAWFEAHPEIGEIPTRWHVGQLVSKTRSDAEKALARIKAGESLFSLAGSLSTDPYGREHNGDMGWFRKGQGLVEIESVLEGLKDGEISDVVETPLGFHILTVMERRPGRQKSYEDVKDRVAQAMISSHLPDFLVALEKKFGVELTPDLPAEQMDTTKEKAAAPIEAAGAGQ